MDQRVHTNMLYHYDMLRPWGRDARVHRRDEGLDVLACSERLKVVVLLATPSVLIGRLEEEAEHLRKKRSSWKQAKRRRAKLKLQRLHAVLDLYRQRERLAELVRDWLDFAEARGAELVFVDTSNEPKVLDLASWMKLLE
jgi:hypothetical protein